MKFALLLARQRSGTGALGSVLGAHPRIRYAGEVFHPDNLGQDDNFFTFLRDRAAEDPEAALPHHSGRMFAEFVDHLGEGAPERVVVLDVKYRSLHHLQGGWRGLVQRPQLIELAMRAGAPILHLTRRNAVETFVSGRLAEANRVWHARRDDEVKVRSAVVNVRQLSNYIVNTERETALVEEWTKGHGKLVAFDYAEMLDAEGCLAAPLAARIAEAFELPAFETRRPAFVKQAPARLEESIENADLVRQALSGTPHAWMLP